MIPLAGVYPPAGHFVFSGNTFICLLAKSYTDTTLMSEAIAIRQLA